MTPASEYDPRYLAGVQLFNDHDYFEAHEVWEDLWHLSTPPERRFYQGLIQAAVGLCHFHNGNLRGAAKLYRSSCDYMQPYQPRYLGLDVAGFWQQMDCCFADILQDDPCPDTRPAEDRLPRIALDPAPPEWPDPQQFLPDEE